jgi:hypothetical protein
MEEFVMNIINKTPHPIHIVDCEGKEILTLPLCPTEKLIRLGMKVVADKMIEEVPTSRTEYGEPVGLPEFREGIFYVVSALVKSALPDRKDLLVPAEVVRDQSGNIIGCRSLGR